MVLLNYSHLFTLCSCEFLFIIQIHLIYFDIFSVFLFFLFYFLTAFLRLEVILQEEKIHKLRESVSHLTDLNRKCDRLRRKDRKFLIDLIETTKRDNVPLTEEQCLKFCEKHRVKNQECDELCSPKVVRCSHWPDSSKCLSLHQENSKYNAKNSLVSDDFEEIPSESHFIRKRRAHIPPQNIVLANAGCL